MDRREFLLAGCAAAVSGCRIPAGDGPLVRFGLVTDIHYAKIPNGPDFAYDFRHYAEGAAKLRRCVEVLNGRAVDFLVELGDFKDLCPSKMQTLACLDEIESEFALFRGPRYHVLGNHDNDCLTKEEFLAHVANACQAKALGHYAFVVNGVTFVVLDANFNAKLEPYRPGNWDWRDANVPPWELEWLAQRLNEAPGHVVIFGHQRLDPTAAPDDRVRNAADVRDLLERSGKVRAVFTGHDHMGGVCTHRGILYYTLRAVVHGPAAAGANAFAEAELDAAGRVTVRGFMRAVDFPTRCRGCG